MNDKQKTKKVTDWKQRETCMNRVNLSFAASDKLLVAFGHYSKMNTKIGNALKPGRVRVD